MHVFVCAPGMIDEGRGAGMSPVSTRQLVQMSPQNFTLIIIRTLPVFLPIALGRVEFKQAGPNAQRAGSNLLTLRLCWRGLALSDSSWSQLVRSRKAGPVSLYENVCMCLCVRERCVRCVFMCASVFTAA